MGGIYFGMKKNQKSKFLKATTAVAVAASVVAVAAPIAPEASTFKDVPSSHQFSDAIKSLSDRGIINGYQDGTFKPGQNLTRGQAAKIIAGVLGLETTNVINPNFKDIPTNHQYYGAIAALKQAGIIDGYEDGTFRQGANIQRNHVAKIIANALNLKSTNADALPFTDVRADYKEAIAALYENNVTTGKTATKFDGASNVTRGQMAAFITRAEAVAKTTPETSRSVSFKVTDYTTAGIIVDGTTYSYSDSVKSIFTIENIEALNGASIVATVTNGVITNVNSLTLNNAGTAEKEVVFKSNATIDALTIKADYVSVSGLIVTGNATVTTNVGNSVELDGSTVNGDLIIDDATVGKVASLDNKFANEEKNGPKVKLKNSKAGKIHVKRNDTAIESDTVLTEITVAASVSLINVDGTVTKVTVESTAKLELTGNANIAQLLLTTAVELALQIKGTVEALAVSNPATQITVGTNLKINELSVPAGSTAAGIVSNFSAIASQIVNVIVGTTLNAGTPSTGGGGAGGGTGGNIQTPNPTPGADALAAAKIAASKLIATDYTPASYRAVTNAVAAAASAKTDIEKLAAAKAITDAIAALVAPTEATIVQSATVSTNDATEDSKGKWTFVITPTKALVKGDQLIISSKDFDLSQLTGSNINANTPDTESVKSRLEVQNSKLPDHHDLIIYLNSTVDAGESITITIADGKITNPKAGVYDKAFVIATSKDVKAKYVPVTIAVKQTPPMDTTSIDTSILTANMAKKGVVEAVTADTVLVGTEWVTTAEMTALTEAITAAINAKITVKTEVDVTNAVTALNKAVDIFNSAKKNGTKVDGDQTEPTNPEVTDITNQLLAPNLKIGKITTGDIAGITWAEEETVEVTTTSDVISIEGLTVTALKAGVANVTVIVKDSENYVIKQGTVMVIVTDSDQIELTPGADALLAAKDVASKLVAADYTVDTFKAVTDAITAADAATTDEEKLAVAKVITDAIAALVEAPTEVMLTSIQVIAPTKVVYTTEDTELDLAGLVVLGKYDNGTIKDLAEIDYTLSSVNFATPGTYTVTVTANGQSDTFEVTVKTPEQVAAEKFLSDLAKAQPGETVTLSENIVLTETLEPAAGVIIDGNSHTITFDNGTGTGDASAEGIFISKAGVVLKNLVIDTVSHGDNLIEIYNSATLENVTVKNSKKNGIYVNHNSEGEITVDFKNITTENNAWAGIGLVAQKQGAIINVNFTGENSFAETVGVYSEQGKSVTLPDAYQGTVNVKGLVEYEHPSKSTFQKAYKVGVVEATSQTLDLGFHFIVENGMVKILG